MGSLYTFTASVFDATTGLSSSDSVLVDVAVGNLVAVVGGGSDQYVGAGSTIVVDGSDSYDEDLTASLAYAWTCSQLEPSISSSCGLVMPSTAGGAAAATLSLSTLASQGASTSLVTLTISDAATGRADSVSVMVSVQAADIPVVAMGVAAQQGEAVAGKAVADMSLSVTGTATSLRNATATWSVNDTSLSLAEAALSPISFKMLATVPSTLPLVLAADTLRMGATLAFTLTCVSDQGLMSSSSVVVTVNAPPTSGTLSLTPSSGTQLVTTFTFSATNWYDPDLPLNYAFLFYDVQGEPQTVQGYGSEAYAT